MENLFILGSPRIPTIDFNVDNNYFIISGRSTSEEMDFFYKVVVDYLDRYKEELIQKNNLEKNNSGIAITFRFNFIYFNTLSIRYLSTIMDRIEKISNTNQVSVIWQASENDEVSIEMANDFNEIFDINLQLIIDEIPVRKKITHKFKDVN